MECVERSYDENVTFHIIFQGQYLPQGFNWNVIASSLPQRVSEKRALEDGEEERQKGDGEKRQKGEEEVEVVDWRVSFNKQCISPACSQRAASTLASPACTACAGSSSS